MSSPSQSSLRFAGGDANYRESTCQRFRVVKVSIQGRPRYEVWERSSSDGWRQVRVNLPTFQEALAAAEGVRFQGGVA
ncbi:MAG: hypothetical protein IT480_06560 [Gammaproteobacteria bacterium]|nr:hypothetical protein [Gammaproteobacteria bacterium]